MRGMLVANDMSVKGSVRERFSNSGAQTAKQGLTMSGLVVVGLCLLVIVVVGIFVTSLAKIIVDEGMKESYR
jgi:hypothetical protein